MPVILKAVLKRSIVTIAVTALCWTGAFSEIKDIGTPYIRNFSRQNYRGGTQNWAVAQDQKGFMYFANNEGLLTFDGVQWQLYRMPNLSMVRSIFIDHDGVIYIGAYNDLGMMEADQNGALGFRSFRNLIPEDQRNFDDVWNIFPFRDGIMFQSYNAAYFYNSPDEITAVKAPVRFQSSYSVAGRLILNDISEGLMEYDGETLARLPGCNSLTGQDIWSVMPFGTAGDLLICTLGKGMFIHDGKGLHSWDVPVNETLKKSQIFSATLLQDDYFAIGTILDGVYIIDRSGKILQHVSKKNGLQNNTILDLFQDRAGNLWLGLDNGIDYVTVNSPVTFIQSSEGFGSGYASIIHEGKLYLGTNQGLYVREWDRGTPGGDFRMIPGTYGQVWYLGLHNGILVCGHNNGTYIIKGETASMVSSIPGGWKYHELKRFPGYMIGGTYSGMILFRWENGTWRFVRRIEGFSESFRVFEEDESGDIWMSHGFKGVFRVRLGDDLKEVVSARFFNSLDGLPSDFYLNVYKIRGRIVVASEHGIYEYAPSEDRFVFSSYYNKLLSPLVSVSYLHEDREGNIWYVAENKTGVFRMQEDFTMKHVTSPFTLLSGRFIHGFESVYPYSPEHLLFGIENGFAHYSPHAYFRSNTEFSSFITGAIEQNLDSVFYFGKVNRAASTARYAFPYRKNSFLFTFTSPVYDNPGNIEYSCKLAGLDDDWSAWTASYTKEYSNLPDGDYVLSVRARNQLGTESLTDSLSFTVLPPWYKSNLAYLSYFMLLITFTTMALQLIKGRIEASSRKERLRNLRSYRAREQEYRHRALESEKELIRMRNEQLHDEMIKRDKELANQAMDLVRKNEFLLRIKEELDALRSSAGDSEFSGKVTQIISRLTREVDSNRQREVFELAFDEVHESFIEKLKARYPALTPTELRLCAFLKMNMSTKEIAPLMNISDRGVEICRYRVRKKMGISRDTNLTTLLLNL